MAYRSLTSQEISVLESNQCRCADWALVEVADNFAANDVRNCEFSGRIRIGERVKIKNVGLLCMDGVSCFGNGTELTLLDENGSRSIRIFNKLTSQLAHLQCFWKSDEDFVEAYDAIIDEYVERQKSRVMTIGDGAEVSNCGEIRNVQIGECAKINGAHVLENGTVLSCEQAPTSVTWGVIARDFIIAEGAQVTDGAQIERCFVGNSSEVGEQFAATDSVFFANCQMMHGESAALFAGPFSVSHHKSTLLIAASLSMFNAGSGSNQSNHMYKSGPIHYGVVDRGSKFGSDSYMAWPSRIGVFSVVLGKHKSKVNVPDFPFSYLVSEGMYSRVLPGLSLRSLGTYRDVNKWESRDKRATNQKNDIINFGLFNPYTIGQIRRGYKRLARFLDEGDERRELDKNVLISRKPSMTGYELYDLALRIYIGLNAAKCDGVDDEWVDLSGMLARRAEIEDLTRSVADGSVDSVEGLRDALSAIASKYDEANASYATAVAESMLGKEQLDDSDLQELRGSALRAVDDLKRLVVADAQKEYEGAFKWNFGIDQSDDSKNREFEILRGKLDKDWVEKLVEKALRIS